MPYVVLRIVDSQMTPLFGVCVLCPCRNFSNERDGFFNLVYVKGIKLSLSYIT